MIFPPRYTANDLFCWVAGAVEWDTREVALETTLYEDFCDTERDGELMDDKVDKAMLLPELEVERFARDAERVCDVRAFWPVDRDRCMPIT